MSKREDETPTTKQKYITVLSDGRIRLRILRKDYETLRIYRSGEMDIALSDRDKIVAAMAVEKTSGIRLYREKGEAPTFREFCQNEYLPYFKNHNKIEKNYATRLGHLRNHFYPRVGDMRLDEIRLKVVLDVHGDMASFRRANGFGYAPKSIGNYFSSFSLAMGYAVKCEYIDVNPVRQMERGDKVVQETRPAYEPKIWSEDEIKIFLAYLAKEDLLEYFAVAALSLNLGVRVGELRGLCWDKVDLENRFVDIDRQFDSYTRTIVDRVKYKKKGKIKRLSLNSQAYQVIRYVHDHIRPSRQKLITQGRPELERVFPALNETVIYGKIRGAMRKAGVPVLKQHEFRHTLAVRMYERGQKLGNTNTVADVQKTLGHAKPHTTWTYLESLGVTKKGEVARGNEMLDFGKDVQSDWVEAVAKTLPQPPTPSTAIPGSVDATLPLEEPLVADSIEAVKSSMFVAPKIGRPQKGTEIKQVFETLSASGKGGSRGIAKGRTTKKRKPKATQISETTQAMSSQSMNGGPDASTAQSPPDTAARNQR